VRIASRSVGGCEGTDGPYSLSPSPFIRFLIFDWVLFVVLADQLWGENLFHWFPRVIACGVVLPFDQVLESFVSPEEAVGHDCFYFIFCLSIDDLWWWSLEIGSFLFRFPIW
jgi:hypothetical protein